MTQAFYSSTPTILLAGEPATEFHGRGASLHHDLDAVALFRPITSAPYYPARLKGA